jgi:hypothetical protein
MNQRKVRCHSREGVHFPERTSRTHKLLPTIALIRRVFFNGPLRKRKKKNRERKGRHQRAAEKQAAVCMSPDAIASTLCWKDLPIRETGAAAASSPAPPAVSAASSWSLCRRPFGRRPPRARAPPPRPPQPPPPAPPARAPPRPPQPPPPAPPARHDPPPRPPRPPREAVAGRARAEAASKRRRARAQPRSPARGRARTPAPERRGCASSKTRTNGLPTPLRPPKRPDRHGTARSPAAGGGANVVSRRRGGSPLRGGRSVRSHAPPRA